MAANADKDSYTQYELPWRDEESLLHELSQRAGLPVRIILTDNRSSVLSVQRVPGSKEIRLRMHRMFLSAQDSVLHALAEWIRNPKTQANGHVLNDFIRGHAHLMREAGPRRIMQTTQGRCHDLRRFYDNLNQAHFDGEVTARITWGRQPDGRRVRHSIRFGSYSRRDHLIRIHPLLDQAFVPAYFVRYIVFHEMLHAYLGFRLTAGGRRGVHHAEFRQCEMAYPDYARALEWQADPDNLRRLMSRKGSYK